MRYSFFIAVLLTFFFAACSVEPLEPIEVKIQEKKVDYLSEIKPILDKRCVVCHSCYNSPCQLKLSSFEGLDRGATKARVYLGERLSAQDPTRLFIDAKTTKEWREKGFNSVTKSATMHGKNDAIMLHLISHKMKHPISSGEYHSESDDLICSRDTKELAEFLDDNPNQGMPFGFPALSQSEFKTLKQWLAQGAPKPSTEQDKRVKTASKQAQKLIDKFEGFLNNPHAKYVMSARYIYEHLFLAHISFDPSSKEFFELVRSSTPSPKPINIIATLRPYDDPEVPKFYYRFRKIESSIVYKTHMVYNLSDEKLQRYKELFIEPKWLEKPYDVGYKTTFNAEPFKVFHQIPAKSRYKFLLDDSEYVIRTFIRGPVCKGQIALNVIHDHFWVMFMDPKYDLSLSDLDYFKSEYKNFHLPNEAGSDMRLIKTFTDIYNNHAIQYSQDRRDKYDEVYKKGLPLDSIWKGENKNSTPFLTVVRHFDSASVEAGALGNLARTAWVIDYPLLERIYYSLVAGFDIFGNVGHQVAVRRYMSRLRVEGESNFINLLPRADRVKTFKSWYIDAEDDEIYSFSKNKSNIKYTKINSKRELLESLIQNHLNKSCKVAFDKINYKKEDERVTKLPKEFMSKSDYEKAFKSLTKKGTGFVKFVNGHNANLAFLRIKMPNEKDKVVSVVVNRWHDNVSFMFDEESRLDSSKDELMFLDGFIGSYPNYFLVVDFKDLDDFFDMINNYDGSQEYIAKFLKYGVSRGDKDFWKHYDWFQKRFYEEKPQEAGLFDLNRYYYKVLE